MKSPAALMQSALAVLAALAVVPSQALYCESLKIDAPNVITLMASKTNPSNQAWVVTPTCGTQTVGVWKSNEGIELDTASIEQRERLERIASLPSDVTELTLGETPVVNSIDASSSNLRTIFMLGSKAKKLDLLLPKGIQTFTSYEGSLETLDNIDFPAGMTRLDLNINYGIRSLRNVKLPAGLKQLSIHSTKLASFDFSIPSSVEMIDVSDSPISKLDGLVLPSAVKDFACDSCGLKSIQGVRWPASITTISVRNNALSKFEIRQSDVRAFESLTKFVAEVAQTSCTGESKTIKGIPICVIDDETFEELYASSNPPSVTSAPSKSSSRSEPSSSSGSENNNDEGHESSANGASKKNTTSTSDGRMSTDYASSRFGQVDDDDATSPSATPGLSFSATLMLVIGAVGSLFVVLLAGIGYRVFIAKRRQPRRSSDTKYRDANTPFQHTIDPDSYSSTGVGGSSTQEYLANDVRNDKNLLPFRIERGEVLLGKLIARGGFGMVYRGKYDGRDVAIKQMQPGAWRNDAVLESFMDEIRLCANLDHPKVVQFVGITWSSLRDLSVLTEFMAGGDLYDLLYQPANRPRPQDWSQPWSTMTVSNLKCKTQMALDVAEAVVYLHSFAAPIIHRDLKSKNVLLDGRGNPKLSDFGISRELVVDETMTSEIGTSAWIAPEVLRGERYSEKADIYSLGVVLVELDRCCHPYEGEPLLAVPQTQTSVEGGRKMASTVHSVVAKSTQIAVLVSTGRLRPSMSVDAPPVVKSLVERCLVNDPEERLTGMEVCYKLRKIVRGMQHGRVTDNEFERAEWLGFNPYVECNQAKNKEYAQSAGLQNLMAVYKKLQYPRPLMFGEFGCNLGANTIDGFANMRGFYDAKWMNEEPEMTAEIVGGNVFEFVTEIPNTVSKSVLKTDDPGRYGIGYFSPANCDHDAVPCEFVPYPEYTFLKTAYTTTPKPTLKMSQYTVERTAVLQCPSNYSSTLQPMPTSVKPLSCRADNKPVCNGVTSNQGEKAKTAPALGTTTKPSNTNGTNTTGGAVTTRGFGAIAATATALSVVLSLAFV